jgi:soluble lytic murein transglycosylase
MSSRWRKAILDHKALTGAVLLVACSGAYAQTSGLLASPPTMTDSDDPQPPPMTPIPYSQLANSTASFGGGLHGALHAARAGDTALAQQLQAGLSDPVAKKLVTWAMIDSAGSNLDYYTLASAQKDLAGWPRSARLRASMEKSLAGTALPPQQVIALFGDNEPETAEGAMALAAAYQAQNRQNDARSVIEHCWRNIAFNSDVQSAMLGRFGIYLTADDHAARLDMLLYGTSSSAASAANAMMPLATPDQQALARARLALRAERSDAGELVAMLPASLQTSPGLAFDRERYYRKHNLSTIAAGLVRYFPASTPERPEVTKEIWAERRALMFTALQSGDNAGAYTAAVAGGLQPGEDRNEAEFFAGWVSLTRLKNVDLAEKHFAKLQSDGETPITLSRAYYWRGRAAMTKGDTVEANIYWGQGAKYYTTFYGQLSAAKIGQTTLALGHDPLPSASERAVFEGRDVIKAARMLGDSGERDLFATFVLGIGATSTSATELAMLVDMTRQYGDQGLALRVVRAGAMRSLYLPERGYPVVNMPTAPGAAEAAFSLSIARQESNFDPHAHSKVAYGLMQLVPDTARSMARKIGLDYGTGRLDDPEFNMRLGSQYLGQLVDEFSGSYVLASAAYNAGPGRPSQWLATCGDPRQIADPADFIECIPFTETRNYVMRTVETMEVYRARLNGGSTPLTIAADLKRGTWTPGAMLHPYQPSTIYAATPGYQTTLSPSGTPMGGRVLPSGQIAPSAVTR